MYNIMNQKAILFGAGGVGLMALDYFGIEAVECFVDNNEKKAGTMLCGKEIISFASLLEKYANVDGYRIYITTDTFFNQLAEQLNANGVENYSFYKDFIPDLDEVIQLLRDNIQCSDKIALLGTTNSTELVLAALKDLNFDNTLECIFDYPESKKIGRLFYTYRVKSINELEKIESSINKIIVTIPDELILMQDNCPCIYMHKERIYASEAIKYLSAADLKEKKEFEMVDPHRIMSSKRLDIIPRYLLMKSIVRGRDDDYAKSLYARTILLWNNADEKIGVFSARAKKTVSEHISCAIELLQDMTNSGFQQKYYIPTSDGILLDGAHRFAAALALNESVWVKNVKNYPNTIDFNWFVNNGFGIKDQIEILRGYADVYSNCGIFIVFSPAFEHWDYIENALKTKMNIVGFFDLDFTKNFYAFQNIINEIYLSYQGNTAMKRKIELLLLMPLVLRVVLVSDEGMTNENLYAYMTQVKLELRDSLTFSIPNEEYLTIHGCSSRKEFETLKEIVLSHNNYIQLIRRTTPYYSNAFLERIGKLKEYCNSFSIPLDHICVVSGSVFEAMGIRKSEDIDVIASSYVRTNINTNSTFEFSDDVEIVSSGRMRDEHGFLVKDDDIVFDHRHYFMLDGVKFCNIELIKYQKMFSANIREKDKRDIRLVEIFEDYSSYFDTTNELKRQMRLRFPLE